MENTLSGRQVIEHLAEIYQQLYLCPGEEGQAQYGDIVKAGEDAEIKSLSHFTMNEKDTLACLDTPAGSVLCVTLQERKDFETFLRIMGHRCEAVEIPKTQGASLLDGVINWRKIYAREEEFFREEEEKGNPDPDWSSEFRRFTSDKKNYLDVIIVLSTGPYSAVSAERMGMPEEEWLTLSSVIRRYHECTHFICRKLYPEKKEPVWDELVADAVGIYAAFRKFDPNIEKLFLGIEGDRYIGGRLENYVEDGQEALAELTKKAARILGEFDIMIREKKEIEPFELVTLLEDSMERLWG
ncbi:MAG: hypothetical protein K6G83_07055 [Lachnospiraceae bacterium]|nr:hypothetical protein [Lachnospiraceae bacterium]